MLFFERMVMHAIYGVDIEDGEEMTIKLMKKHFVDGMFVNRTASGVIRWGAFVISFLVGFYCWERFDDKENMDSFDNGETLSRFIPLLLFSVIAPSIGFLVAIILAGVGRKEGWQPAHYVVPLAAILMACCVRLLLNFLAFAVIDALDSMYVCFAIDRSEGRISEGRRVFYLMVMEMDDILRTEEERNSSQSPYTSNANQNNRARTNSSFAELEDGSIIKGTSFLTATEL